MILLINDKICRCTSDKNWRCNQLVEILAEKKGIQSVFTAASSVWYDPKYGIPRSYETMNVDHRAEVEHMMVNSYMSGDDWKRWEVIGRVIFK